MEYSSGHVLTLANSIIGVSILAMPYCFKQCGILLSITILCISSIISRLACHFLIKSAILARRKTFEFLAFHIFGSLGKFSIEIGMIGFLLGTCIAFFVVMGDLAPDIVSEITGAKTGYTLRNGILISLAFFCVLPLGLLKNVDSLNGVSKATICFYCSLVLKTVVEALPHIFTGDWFQEVALWRPGGILQCLPIFSMALFCQSQIFEIYQALPNASLEKMNNLIRVAVNMCTGVYIFVGTFGYIAFFQQSFTGNILLSFKPSIMSDCMKIGFILSLAFSFPLVIFPCRASLYSLLYKEAHYSILHEGTTSNYIPEMKFKILTLFIVVILLIIGLAIPNIELVLGLVGSTIGVVICVLFPVTCFICISPKNTNERILAQLMVFVGIIVMVLGTYANLYAYEVTQLQISKTTEKTIEKSPVLPQLLQNEGKDSLKEMVQDILLNPNIERDRIDIETPTVKSEPSQKSVIQEKLPEDEIKRPLYDFKEPPPRALPEKNPTSTSATTKKSLSDSGKETAEQKLLIDTLKEQNKVQQEIVKQNKIIIEAIQKQQSNVKVDEEKLKAVKNIESIALKAIESLSGTGDKNNAEKKENESVIQMETVEKEKKSSSVAPLEVISIVNKMAPIPIVLSKRIINSDALNATKTQTKEEIKESVKVEDPKLVVRDILEEKQVARTKREVNEYNEAIKAVCREMNTEIKPSIKILCKLSANLRPLQSNFNNQMRNDEIRKTEK